MKLDHRFTRLPLSEYVDDEISPAQRRRVEAHADVCPDCGATLRKLLAIVPRLHALRAAPGEHSIAPRVIARLRTEHASPISPRSSRRGRRSSRVA